MAQRDIRQLSDEQLFASWSEWITRTSEELAEVYLNRHVFLNIKAMFDNNRGLISKENADQLSESAHFVLGWLARLYAHDTLMFMRSEFDSQRGTINLLSLFSEIEQRPGVLTRRRYR